MSAGYYTRFQKRILREQLGYDARVITFEPLNRNWRGTHFILKDLVEVGLVIFLGRSANVVKLLALDAGEGKPSHSPTRKAHRYHQSVVKDALLT